jgi:hypothetical protein
LSKGGNFGLNGDDRLVRRRDRAERISIDTVTGADEL